jgi:hypothetical protein
MENFIDDNEAYVRLQPRCRCGCVRHCGFSCMTDSCDCLECACPMCKDDYDLLMVNCAPKNHKEN